MNYSHDIYYIRSNKDLTDPFVAADFDNTIEMIMPVIRCEIVEKVNYSLPEIRVILPLSDSFHILRPIKYNYIYDCKRHWLFLFKAHEIVRLLDVSRSVSTAAGTGDYKNIDKVNAMLLNNYISKHLFKGFCDGSKD